MHSILSLSTVLLSLVPSVTPQSIQGFIYWDADFNGILSEGVLNPSGIYLRELQYGVVNVKIDVNRCGSEEPVTNGFSGWLSSSIELSTSISKIHSNAGYYKIDVSGSNDESSLKGCLVDDEDLRELGQGKNESHVDKNYKSVGCYISISSPKDHEITTTFPLGNAKSEELNSIEGDIFHWIHYNDTGPVSKPRIKGDDIINRGYQTRTTECIGYNTDDNRWYVWNDQFTVSQKHEENYVEAEESRSAILVDIPNAKIYGYERYLTLNSYNYDGVLSISPVGMVENMWPLPLRVKSDVYFGIKFGQSKGLKGQFKYEPISEEKAAAASTYQPHYALSSETELEISSSNVFLSNGADAQNDYVLANADGILSDATNLEDVIHSFLKKEVLVPSRESGLEHVMLSLNAVVLDHWSMIKIIDTQAASNSRRHLEEMSLASAVRSTSSIINLRGYKPQHRNLMMREPHQVFYFQVYATYSSRSNSGISSMVQTTNGFSMIVEHAINTRYEDLVQDIRKKTGFEGPHCISSDSSTSINETEVETLESYSIFDFGGDSLATTVKCSDLLPLYFYDVNRLECRVEMNNNANLYEKVKLSMALDALKAESKIYGVIDSSEEVVNSPGSSFWIYVVFGAVGVTMVVFGLSWVVYERKRRAVIRKNRLAKKQRRAQKKLRKKEKSDDLDRISKSVTRSCLEKGEVGSLHLSPGYKIDDGDSSDDNSELDRLFNGTSKSEDTDLEQSNLKIFHVDANEVESANEHNALCKSGVDVSTSHKCIDEVANYASFDRKIVTKKKRHEVTVNPNNTNTIPRKRKEVVRSVMSSFRKSATNMVLGRLDINDLSDMDSNSSNSSSTSEMEQKKTNTLSSGHHSGRGQVCAPNHGRAKVASATSAIRSSFKRVTQAISPPNSGGVSSHSRREHKTVSKIRSSLRKKKKPIKEKSKHSCTNPLKTDISRVDVRQPCTQNDTSEKMLEVPMQKIKPSKNKSTRRANVSNEDCHFDRRRSEARRESSIEGKYVQQKAVVEDALQNPRVHQNESVLQDSIVQGAYLPHDLKRTSPRPFMIRGTSDKYKSNIDIDFSSSSQLSSHRSSSAHESSVPHSLGSYRSNSAHESSVSHGGKGNRKSKMKRPSRRTRNSRDVMRKAHAAPSSKQKQRKAVIEKLNELKSSLSSSLRGKNKLSGAAISILEGADAPYTDGAASKKISKSRSIKSSRSFLKSETSVSNRKEKHSEHENGNDMKKRREQNLQRS